MYLSLESMLCFFWLFLFLFYTQCMYYLCFFWVYIGLKFVIKKKVLKDILSCLWFIIYKCLLRPNWVCNVCADEKKVKASFRRWSWHGCLWGVVCYISFYEADMTVVVKEKRLGKNLLIKKNFSRTGDFFFFFSQLDLFIQIYLYIFQFVPPEIKITNECRTLASA